MTNSKNIIASTSHMNGDISMAGSQLPSTDHSTMTVAEALLKYWAQISAGWNEQTKMLYLAIYLQIIAPIGDVPAREVDVHKHIYPLIAPSVFLRNSLTPMRVCKLPPDLKEYLLRRLFWTFTAAEGFPNPFDMVIA